MGISVGVLSDEQLSQEIDYILAVQGIKPTTLKSSSIVPRPLIVQVPLVECFERLHNLKARRWQRDFCERLQEAAVNRHVKGVRAAAHAEAQAGKSLILLQAYAAWLFGHDPLHRFGALTYNITNSQKHSETTIRLMLSNAYKDMFPDKDCHIPAKASKEKFFTNARREYNDGQPSYNPMSMLTGFTGNGAETVAFDDMYSSIEDALSTAIRAKVERSFTTTTLSRLTLYTNVFAMAHRYLYEDFTGFCLREAGFVYWRYASQADGDYKDESTGRVFPDPLGREIGEYLIEGKGDQDYAEVKKYATIWSALNQGRPSAEAGTFFEVAKIIELEGNKAIQKAAECVYWVRAWDNAATEDDGAFTAGILAGITATGDVVAEDLQLEQFETAARLKLQLDTAKSDGKDVPVHIPQDPGSAGKDVAFLTKQKLAAEGYNCITKVVTGKKQDRARPASLKVNNGFFYMVKGLWNKQFKEQLQQFPLSIYKDIVDALADAVTYLEKLLTKGTVIKGFEETINLITWSKFAKRFGKKIPPRWNIYVACNYYFDASLPSGAVILARPPASAMLGEVIFMVGCNKQRSGDFTPILLWLEKMLGNVIDNQGQKKLPAVRLSLNKEAETLLPLLRQKLKLSAVVITENETAGIPETNWYIQPDTTRDHPFNPGQPSTRFFWLTADRQIDSQRLKNEYGLLSARQEVNTWSYNDQGKPQPYGGTVLNCVRMILANFRTDAAPLTVDEAFATHIETASPELTPAKIAKMRPQDREEAQMTLEIERKKFEKTHERGEYRRTDFTEQRRRDDDDEGGGFEPL